MRILSVLFDKFLARRRAGKEVKDFLYSMEEMEESYPTAAQKMPDLASSIPSIEITLHALPTKLVC